MAATSNDYTWDADAVLKQIIQERGRSKVMFTNGIWTDWSGFINQRQNVEEAFGLWTINLTPTSFSSFDGIHNPSKGEGYGGNIANEVSHLGNSLTENIFKPALDGYREYWKNQFPDAPIGAKTPDGLLAGDFASLNGESDNYATFKLVRTITTLGSASLITLSSPLLARDKISDFVARFVDLQNLNFGDDPPTDLTESVSQYFSKAPSPASQSVNNQWSLNWLDNPNNSLIIVAHSQGNFFIEDGLIQKNSDFFDPSRLKMLSLGSPTDYSSLSSKYEISEFTNSSTNFFGDTDDPVTRLRFSSNESDRNRFRHLLDVIPTWLNIIGYGSDVVYEHDLGKYLNRQDVKDKFESFFYELHPKGYYFPERLVNQFEKKGTVHGDFIEGSEQNDVIRGGDANNPANDKNDVLRGMGGDDNLIGDAGYDFLDGGSGTDTADYSDWDSPIEVHQKYLPGANSDIYRVIDNIPYAVEDILVDIEQIKGTKYHDEMYGGKGKDIFYGQGGNDELWGEGYSGTFGDPGQMQDTDEVPGGPDEFHGGSGNDILRGQGGNDELYGDGDNDILFGGSGQDLLRGGSGDDWIEGGSDRDLIFGGQDRDTIDGGLEKDIIYAEEGNDHIHGGEEDDIIWCGEGDDWCSGDSGYGHDTVYGEQGNDELYGQGGNDLISGGVDNDSIYGGDENDQLFGDDGDDQIEGNLGNDNLSGGTGNDSLSGDAGDDKVAGDEGEDILRGGDGADEILGGEGQDFIVAESGYDTIDGGAGIDTVDYSIAPSGVLVNIDDLSYNNQTNPGEFDLEVNFDIALGTGLDGFGTVDKLISLGNIIGSAFNDTLIGNSPDNHIQAGAGDDLIISTEGKDIYDGQDGIDVISFRRDANAVYVDLKEGFANDGFQAKDSIAQIENVVGSNFSDRIYADDIANTITGGKGNDTIDGRGSSDLIYGEANNDVIYGADGEDTLYGNSGNDIIDGGAGNDTLDGAEGDDQLFGQAGNDTLDAGDGNDTLSGGDNEDILYGRTGNDSLDGGSGNDSLDAAAGDDRLFGQAGNDTLDAGDGKDTLSGGDDDDILYGRTGSDSLDGGLGNDSLDAAEGDDKLFGQAGNDTLDAGSGNDIVSGGDGEDILYGRNGNDSLDAGLGNDYLDAGDGNDTSSGGDGEDTLLGQTGDDTLDGGLGNDSIDAGDGKDTVTGGNDADTIVAGTGDDYIDGGEGNDRIFGNEDKDTIYGRTGDDYIDAGRGSDRIFGESGNDTILGQTGRDSIDGGEGADSIHGGTEDDTITGQTGDDTFTGGGDRDWFIVKLGDNTDVITDFGGVGRGTSPLPEIIAEVDTIKFIGTGLSSQNMLLTQVGTDLAITFENIDNNKVILQNFALENIDNLLISKGSAVDLSNIFFDGDENLEDSDTFDVINVETQPTEVNHKDVATFLNDLDNNTKGFDNSQDIINGQGGNDTLSGLSGNDTLRGGEGNDSLLGGVGNDYLKGDAGNDILLGENGADRLNGNAGDDSLYGGIGNDTISGDTGNDTLTGGGNQDLFVIKAGDGNDLITDFGGVGKGRTPSNQVIAEVDTLKFIGAGLIAKNMLLTQEGTDLAISFHGIDNTKITLQNFTLENLDNLLTSKGASVDISNLLFDGDENIQQSDTFDIMNGDEVVTLVYHKDVATFLNDLDNNTSGYSNSNDIINGQGGNDTLTGLSGDDILRGGSGDDLLNGGSGKDTLNGGIGKDTFVLTPNAGGDIITDFVSGQDLLGLTGGLTSEQLTFNPGGNGLEISFQNQLLASLIGVQTPLTNADFTII